MIQVSSATYSTYEASNLQNVEFFYSNGGIVPSWLESGNSNTATNTTYWLNIADGIPAGSNITVYMGFASTLTSLLNSQTTGEAPQLSPSYGQYDNGKIVFSFYDNFASGSSNSAWSITGGSFVRDNHLSLNLDPNDYFATSQTFGPGTAFDAFVTQFQDTDNVGYINTAQPAFVPTNGWAGALIRSMCIDIYPDQQNGAGDANGCGGSYGSFYSGIASIVGVYSIDVITTTSSVQSINYSQGSTSQPINTYSPNYPASVGFMAGNGYDSFTAQWVRVRAAPANGVMPSVTIGALTTLTPTSNSLACSPSPLAAGSNITCTATVTGSTPTGTVSFTSTGSGTFTPINGQCTLTGGACSVAYSQNTVGSPTINASYGGDSNNLKSSDSVTVTFKQAATTTNVVCTPSSPAAGGSTTCTATVSGVGPTGTVSWASTGTGSFTGSPCTLTGGTCSVNYTQAVSGTPKVTATYDGDGNNLAGSGTTTVTFNPDYTLYYLAAVAILAVVVVALVLARRRAKSART
jgi:hypothetical protein